ncbi:MAG: DNA-directed RNA polymerase subunit omega [Acidobacteriota bacterium]
MSSRIRVNECLKKIPNRFSLAIIAAKRMEQLMGGGLPRVPTEKGQLLKSVFEEIAQDLVEYYPPEEQPEQPPEES